MPQIGHKGLGRKLRRGRRVAQALALAEVTERGEEIVSGEVEPLTRDAEEVERTGQFPGGRAKAIAAIAELPADHRARAGALVVDIGDKLRAHRHGGFGGGGGGRGAMVGGVVDKRCVGLVANARDHRNAARSDGTDDDLFVERPEVFD